MIFDFTHNLGNLILLAFNLIQTILILLFSFIEVALVNLDLFIQNMSLLVSSDQLGTQNISFRHHQVIFFLQFLTVLFTLFDNLMQFFDLLRLNKSSTRSSISSFFWSKNSLYLPRIFYCSWIWLSFLLCSSCSFKIEDLLKQKPPFSQFLLSTGKFNGSQFCISFWRLGSPVRFLPNFWSKYYGHFSQLRTSFIVALI